MDAFPAFIPLAGRRVIVAGEGEAADAKARLFVGSPAVLVRIAHAAAALEPQTYAGAALVFVAGEEGFCREVIALARGAGALANAVDRPALSDFFTPALIDRGAVVGAIGTGGAAPVLATRLRGEWEARWPEGLGRLAQMLRAVQASARARWPDPTQRRAVLRALLDGPAARAALAGDPAADTLALAEVEAAERPRGAVTRLAAPADLDDLTLGQVRLLGRADRIVAGPQVPAELLAYARRDALRSETLDPAETEAWAAAGEQVVVVA